MDNSYLIIAGFVYLITCIWIAVEADFRGHGWFNVFTFCLFCTPLIGAIIFSHYKPK